MVCESEAHADSATVQPVKQVPPEKSNFGKADDEKQLPGTSTVVTFLCCQTLNS